METESIASRAAQFQRLCIKILVKLGFEDDTDLSNWRNPAQADFVGLDPLSKTKVIVECKLTLSIRATLAMLRQTTSQLLAKREFLPGSELMLIVTSDLPDMYVEQAKQAGIDRIWDLKALLQRALETNLYGELSELLRDVGTGDLGTMGDAPIAAMVGRAASAAGERAGKVLCSQLHAIQPGKADASRFEKICEEALTFLFGEQFGAWHSQSVSEEGFHRRDFLVRLRPQHDFWISLAHDFRSRYLIFEFKNYAESIGQNEVYTTEKYLFTKALRSVAIIIARGGWDEGASRAAGGALRESGKLILIVSLAELCEMLDAADKDQEPEILMYRKLDDLLTKMLR